MIINQGILKNKKITLPSCVKYIRPTSAKIREAVFHIIKHKVQGSVFYDMFCGSGIIGLYALSLGAKKVYFVDKKDLSLKHIKKHLQNFSLLSCSKCYCMSVSAFLRQKIHEASNRYTIAYFDPPYGYSDWPSLLSMCDIAEIQFDLIIIETDKILKDFIDKMENFDMNKLKVYKEKRIYFLSRADCK